MRRVLIWLLAVSALCWAAVALSDIPGMMQFEWLGYRITLASSLFIAAIAISTLVVIWLTSIWVALTRWPERKRTQRALLYQTMGLGALTRAATAMSMSDMTGAKKEIVRARRHLKDAPLALLMQAQWHEKQGEATKASGIYQQLSAFEDTAKLGLRGLLQSAQKARDYTRALSIASEAIAQFPEDKALLKHTLELMLRAQKVTEAEELLERWRSWRLLSRAERHHMHALIALTRAEAATPEMRIGMLREAHSYLPHHTAIGLKHLQLLLESKDIGFPSILRREWRHHPSPNLTALAQQWLSAQPADKREKAARKIAKQAPYHLESHLLLAWAAEARNALLQAKSHAEDALAVRESRRALEMVARCERELANEERAAPWATRAASASGEETWVCQHCGHSTEEWMLFCPACDACDSAEITLPATQTVQITSL